MKIKIYTKLYRPPASIPSSLTKIINKPVAGLNEGLLITHLVDM